MFCQSLNNIKSGSSEVINLLTLHNLTALNQLRQHLDEVLLHQLLLKRRAADHLLEGKHQQKTASEV